MRKFHTFFVAAALVGGGLVAGGATSASAAPGYPDSINTKCQGKALNNPRANGAPARIRVRVKPTEASNAAPRGKVVVRYVRRSNGDVARKFRRDYDGPGYEKYSFADVPRGRYRVEVDYNAKPARSVFKDCGTSFRQRIR
jgi:hypothetical protein